METHAHTHAQVHVHPRRAGVATRTILQVGALAGMAAGLMYAAWQMLVAAIAQDPTAVPTIHQTLWTPPEGIWSVVFGVHHFHGSFHFIPVFGGIVAHLGNALILGILGVALLTAILGRRPNFPAAVVLGVAYGIAVDAILLLGIINTQKIQTLYSASPHWSWWVGHGIFGVTLGLLGSVLLRRNNPKQAEVPLATSSRLRRRSPRNAAHEGRRSELGQSTDARPRVVIVGAGFSGFHCARWLDRHLTASTEVVLVSPGDHTVYSALLPDVAGGVVDPEGIATPLAASLPSTTVVVGTVTAVDADAQTCTVHRTDGEQLRLKWDRLVLNPGSVTETFGIAGVREYTHGFKTIAETVYLRERILRQLQLAAAAEDAEARKALGSFVVVGGGFTGLELAAQGHKLARAALRQHRGLDSDSVRWTVIEAGPSVLAQFPPKLANHALARMRRSGIDVRLGTPVAEVTPDHVTLVNGETLATRTVVWTAGVAPAPLISEVGLAVERGRLIVDDALQARDHPHVFALGDAAAVPDLTRPGHLAAQTAQHAQRQGVTAARNVAASLANRETRAYRHKDLGFTVDLTGRNAIATPFGLRLSGILAKIAGRAYHLMALPSGRLRVLSDWVNALIGGPHIIELGLVDERYATIQAEATAGQELGQAVAGSQDE